MASSARAQAQVSSPDLMEVLRSRRDQARDLQESYGADYMAQDTMLYWLAQAAKNARKAAGRKQVHIAASANKDQSTVYRFEQGLGWPRETDLFVAAYADDLDIEPVQIWETALEMWRQSGNQANVAELQERRASKVTEFPVDDRIPGNGSKPAPTSSRAAKGKRGAAKRSA